MNTMQTLLKLQEALLVQAEHMNRLIKRVQALEIVNEALVADLDALHASIPFTCETCPDTNPPCDNCIKGPWIQQ